MKTKGFTLIELMIVVTILGILEAIAVPKIPWVIRQSKNEARKRRGLPPLPEPRQTDCYGPVVSAFTKDGKIVKVYQNGCVETN